LRQFEFTELIRSGYIGTHSVDTELLKTIIDDVAKGKREIVLAWQQEFRYNTVSERRNDEKEGGGTQAV